MDKPWHTDAQQLHLVTLHDHRQWSSSEEEAIKFFLKKHLSIGLRVAGVRYTVEYGTVERGQALGCCGTIPKMTPKACS